MTASALPLSSGQQLRAHPRAPRLAGTVCGSVDQREFVIGEAQWYGVTSRVVAGRSSKLGHDDRIASTETLARVHCAYTITA